MCPRPRAGKQGRGRRGCRGRGGGASLLAQGHVRAWGGPNPLRCSLPRGRGEGHLWVLPGVRVGRGQRVRQWKRHRGGGEEDAPEGALLVPFGMQQQ